MKYLLTLFLVLTTSFLVAQSAFQREYGPPSERNRESVVAVLTNSTSVTIVYAFQGGLTGPQTLEFVQADPHDGSIVSRESIPYPFLSAGLAQVLVLTDSILVLIDLINESDVGLIRFSATGEILAADTVSITISSVGELRTIEAPGGEMVLAAVGNGSVEFIRFNAEMEVVRRATYDSLSDPLLDFTVLANGDYLTLLNADNIPARTRRIDPGTGLVIEDNELQESSNVGTFSGKAFLRDPADGNLILAMFSESDGARVPLIYRLDSLGVASSSPYTLGFLLPETFILFGFNPNGLLVYGTRNFGLFAFPDYRQANNQSFPIAGFPSDRGRTVNNPITAFSPEGDIYYVFNSCANINDCDVVLTRAELSTEIWRLQLGATGRLTADKAKMIDTDASGNIYLLSESPNEEGLEKVTTVLKLTPDGDSIWTRKLPLPEGFSVSQVSMTLRGDGLLFVQQSSRDFIYSDVLNPDGTSAHPRITEQQANVFLYDQIKSLDVGGGVVLSVGERGGMTIINAYRSDGSRRSSFTTDRMTDPTALARLEDNFIMIMGREPREPYRFTIVKYDLAENREVWFRNLGNSFDSGVADCAEDLIVMPNGDYLLAANNYNYNGLDALEGVSLYRISPGGDVDPPAYTEQEISVSNQPLKLAVNASDEPVLVSYTRENGEKVFRTIRYDTTGLSVIQTYDVVLPESFEPADNFTFSLRGFALCYGTVAPDNDRSTQLFLLSEKVITNPVATSTGQEFDADLEIFPNPTSGPATLKVDLPRASPLTVESLDFSGRVIFKSSYPSALRHRIELSGDDLPVGISVLRVTDDKGRQRSLRVVRGR